MSVQDPMWLASTAESPAMLLNLVGQEGVDRLCLGKMWPLVDRATDAVAPAVGEDVASALNEFIVNLAVEAAWVAASLGAALADEGCQHRSFEGWLAAAIAKAELTGYAPATRLELPEQT